MVTHLEDLCFALKSQNKFWDFEALNLRDTSSPRPSFGYVNGMCPTELIMKHQFLRQA